MEIDIVIQIIIGLVFFLLAWLVARHYYHKGLKIYKLTSYLISLSKASINLDRQFEKDFDIKYKGRNIGELYQAQFLIINTGNIVIDKFKKPLALEIPNKGKIVAVNLPYKSNASKEILYETVKNNDKYFLNFIIPFLEKKESFITSILIKGAIDQDQNFFFTISVPNLPNELKASKLPSKKELKKVSESNIFLLIVGLISLIIWIFLTIFPEWRIQNNVLNQLLFLLLGVMTGFGAAMLEGLIKDFNRNRFYKRIFSYIPSEYLK